VEAELVFVNYAIPADYEELERLGIDVKGKIVIAKYAGSWRGIKPKLAAEKGAIGCIIYSDPKDDGYYSGDTYPDGAFKNETGVQRGSVMDTPFIQHAGIAALNLGYFGENEGGEYHTIYDTYPQYKRFKDPAFEYGIALAKTAGSIVLRLTNSDVLTFEFQQWNSTVSGYMAELVKLTNDMRTTVEKHNVLVEKNVFELAADPTKTFVKPVKKELIPYLDFTPLQNKLVALNKVITDFAAQDFSQLDQAKSDKLNEKLLLTERALMNETGLPRRPWYKHQIYAPGFYTGYGVKTLPYVREAIEQENWEEATEQIKVLTNTLSGFKNHIKELLSIVE
jgi:N-acetylated-alpha-linked acidic dipeptidase